MKKLEAQLHMKLPLKLVKRKAWYLATCPVLDVSSQGATESEAKKNLVEALGLFFASCIERGTLDAVLKECGFTLRQTPAKAPKTLINRKDYIDIPIHFLVNSGAHSRCHA